MIMEFPLDWGIMVDIAISNLQDEQEVSSSLYVLIGNYSNNNVIFRFCPEDPLGAPQSQPA
jgi:hypothetical protein